MSSPGGQRQRICIVRCPSLEEAELIIADEALSALDVSIQGQNYSSAYFASCSKMKAWPIRLLAMTWRWWEKMSYCVAVLHLGQVVR